MKTSERLLEAVLRNVYMFFCFNSFNFYSLRSISSPRIGMVFFASLGFVIGLAGAYLLVDSYEA